MENSTPGHEKQDDATPEARSKKKRSASRLSQYLSGLRGKENDVSGEKNDEKPKRFRRLFNKIFPQVVESPSQEEKGEQQHDFDYESWFSWTGFANRPESAGVTPASEASESTSSATPEETVTDVSAETAEDQSEAPRTKPYTEEHSTPDKVENPFETSSKPEVSEDHVTPPEIPAIPSRQEVFNRQQEEQELVQAASSGESSTKEVIIERGSGAALPVLLVGAEYIARKRADRKLEGRLNEKIKASQEQLDDTATLQQEIETVVKQNREQLDALKQAREGQVPVEAPPIQKIIERPSAARSERVTTPEQKIGSTERVQSNPEVKEQLRPLVERNVTKEEVQPEKIMEQVADAAEHDIPVERIFERSHEVKDDRTVPGAAASVGAVMNSQAVANQYQALQQVKQPVGTPGGGPLPFVSDSAARIAYKQAVKMGFWGAVMIIILGAIAYLVVK